MDILAHAHHGYQTLFTSQESLGVRLEKLYVHIYVLVDVHLKSG